MDFSFSADQEAYRRMIQDFIKRECPPELDREIEENERFPIELMPKLAATGIFGLCFPEEYGGSGGNAVDFCLAVEELAYGSEAACACYLLPVFFAGQMIHLNGSEEQKKEFLPKIIAGQLKGAFALTEPGAGSDASAISTRGTADGDDFVLNGFKHYISGADAADYIMTCTRTDDDRHNGITIFMVPRDAPGLTIRRTPKMGSKCVSLCELTYENVRVPRSAIIGGPDALNKGWYHMMSSLDLERVMVAITHVSIARKAYEAALDWAKIREQFGRPISKYQAVQFQLVNMAIDVEAGRNLAYKAAWQAAHGERMSKDGSIAKVFCTEMARRVTQDAMQVFGGGSYLLEHDAQRWARMAMLGPIGMGTNNIQRMIIATNLGLN